MILLACEVRRIHSPVGTQFAMPYSSTHPSSLSNQQLDYISSDMIFRRIMKWRLPLGACHTVYVGPIPNQQFDDRCGASSHCIMNGHLAAEKVNINSGSLFQ